LPNHEFGKFLEDDDQITPARLTESEQVKADEAYARALQNSQ
jgi:hypothetical protein